MQADTLAEVVWAQIATVGQVGTLWKSWQPRQELLRTCGRQYALWPIRKKKKATTLNQIKLITYNLAHLKTSHIVTAHSLGCRKMCKVVGRKHSTHASEYWCIHALYIRHKQTIRKEKIPLFLHLVYNLTQSSQFLYLVEHVKPTLHPRS